MRPAYVDSSCLVAIALGEPESCALASRLDATVQLVSSNLLEAELRSALAREGSAVPEALLGNLHWVYPARSLGPELKQVVAAGYLSGADLWHLACALYLRRELGDLAFATLDRRQAEVARALGFPDL
jgi:predicted nucleic acid-binding protein